MEHNFNTAVAKDFGIAEAVILHNFFFWIERNKANRENFYDGRYWTYNSVSALGELFPYLSERQIGYAINKLVDGGALIKGNYNTNKYDRTIWYAVSEETLSRYYQCNTTVKPEVQEPEPIVQNNEIHLPFLSNGISQNVQPIPDSKPDSKLNIFSDETGNSNKNASDGFKESVETEEERLSRLKEVKKEIKKKLARSPQPDPLWSIYVETWVAFSKDKCNFNPVINKKEMRNLKDIVGVLRSRAEKSGVEWNEVSARTRFGLFLESALSKDDWLRNNFSLSNMNSQINAIFKICENGKQPKTAAKASYGKSAGTIALIDGLVAKFGQRGT
jgi:hypothetical protein